MQSAFRPLRSATCGTVRNLYVTHSWQSKGYLKSPCPSLKSGWFLAGPFSHLFAHDNISIWDTKTRKRKSSSWSGYYKTPNKRHSTVTGWMLWLGPISLLESDERFFFVLNFITSDSIGDIWEKGRNISLRRRLENAIKIFFMSPKRFRVMLSIK